MWPSLTLTSWDLMLSSGPCRHQVHVVNKHMQIKVKLNLENKIIIGICQFYCLLKMKESLPTLEMDVLISHKELNVSWMFDTVEDRASSTSFAYWWIFIIPDAENAHLHEYIVQNGRSIFRVISETVKILSESPVKIHLRIAMKPRSATQFLKLNNLTQHDAKMH